MNKAQIISAVQEKGGAGKSTLVCCLASRLVKDGAKVLIIDTDRQESCIEWADAQEMNNLDYMAIMDEDKLITALERMAADYDVILVDTAGYDSKMLTYSIQASDLILIPTGGDRHSIKHAVKTYRHAVTATKFHNTPPKIRVVLWRIKPDTVVYKHARGIIADSEIPFIDCEVPALTGFELMSWTGGIPDGRAGAVLNQFFGAMQIDGLIDYYNSEKEVAHG